MSSVGKYIKFILILFVDNQVFLVLNEHNKKGRFLQGAPLLSL